MLKSAKGRISEMNCHSSKKTIDRIFQCIFLLFKLSFIFPFPELKGALSMKMFSQVLAFTFSLLLCSFHFFSCYKLLEGMQFNPLSITHTFITFCSTVNRIYLSIRLSSLKDPKVAIIPCRKELRPCYGPQICIVIFWIICTLAANMYICFTYMMTFYENSPSVPFDLRLVAKILESITLLFCIMMPFHLFAIYYYLICHEVRDKMRGFKNLLNTKKNVNYEVLYKAFCAVQDNIQITNNSLDIFVFINVLYTGSVLYIALTIVLHPELYTRFARGNTIFIISYTFTFFVFMMMSAIGVNDESLEIANRARRLRSAHDKGAISQLRFHLNVSKEMCMTIWGMGPITRSSMVSVFGTAFTFSILVDGIWSMKFKSDKLDILNAYNATLNI